jgi:hypothetical protein
MKKVIVISGGSDGLGYETAKLLSPKHAVIILSNDRKKLEKAAEELSCDFEVCDVSKPEEVQKAVDDVVRKNGRLDCLVNNAGIWIEGELTENDPEHIKRALEVNTFGAIILARAVLPQMKKQKQGLIINVISQAGLYGKPERSVYDASKFAITGFTKSLQMEVAKYGTRVTGLYPGKMKTGLFKKAGYTKDLSDAIEPLEVAKTIEFVISNKDTTLFPEIGVKDIKN